MLAGCLAFAEAPVRASAGDCPEPGDRLLVIDCEGAVSASALLLPEDAAALGEAPGPRVVITGAYTSAESRDDGLPLPVGLFVRGGEIVSRLFAPMDGVLLIDAEGGLSLHHRERVEFGGESFDLNDTDARHVFLHRAAGAGLSVMQSHLLIVDGELDVRPVEDAPRFRRRLLFVDAEGRAGIWQSGAALTLHDAAALLAEAHAPEMALNLDMGSYDLCLRLEAGAAPEEGTSCGLIGWNEAAKLSNLLVFDLPVD